MDHIDCSKHTWLLLPLCPFSPLGLFFSGFLRLTFRFQAKAKKRPQWYSIFYLGSFMNAYLDITESHTTKRWHRRYPQFLNSLTKGWFNKNTAVFEHRRVVIYTSGHFRPYLCWLDGIASTIIQANYATSIYPKNANTSGACACGNRRRGRALEIREKRCCTNSSAVGSV